MSLPERHNIRPNTLGYIGVAGFLFTCEQAARDKYRGQRRILPHRHLTSSSRIEAHGRAFRLVLQRLRSHGRRKTDRLPLPTTLSPIGSHAAAVGSRQPDPPGEPFAGCSVPQ
jgi:hypothetical protein